MKKKIIFSILLCSFSFAKLRDCTTHYFTPVWYGNPYLPMSYFVVSATVNDQLLSPGDEIAIFEGEICIGACVVPDEGIVPPNYSIVVSKNDGSGNGYIEGNEALFRIWLTESNEEIVDVFAEYFDTGTGNPIETVTFESLSDAVVELRAEHAINENMNGVKTPIDDFLDECFPNPFNPETTIHFEIARHQHVRVDVFDVLGKRQNTLLVDTLVPGKYSIAWNGKNETNELLPSGLYFIRLVTEKNLLIRKVVLLR